MKSVWHVVMRTLFWSFERGTWPYDIAVGVIVVFVLLSPRSWFHDRPPVGPPPNPAMVQFRGTDATGAIQNFRIDARLLTSQIRVPESELEHQLHEAVSHNVHDSNFVILRIEPVRGDNGTVAYYDVAVKP